MSDRDPHALCDAIMASHKAELSEERAKRIAAEAARDEANEWAEYEREDKSRWRAEVERLRGRLEEIAAWWDSTGTPPRALATAMEHARSALARNGEPG